MYASCPYHDPNGCLWPSTTVLRKNLASAKIVKIEFNAKLDLLGSPHFITFKECRKVP